MESKSYALNKYEILFICDLLRDDLASFGSRYQGASHAWLVEKYREKFGLYYKAYAIYEEAPDLFSSSQNKGEH